MPLVTAIKPQKKAGFVNVFLDSQFAFSLSDIDCASQKLKVGEEVNQSRVKELKAQSKVSKMMGSALRYISRRPHSQSEVESFLKRKFVDRGDLVSGAGVTQGLEKLRELELINDGGFARWLLGQRLKGPRAKGLRFIRSELYQKGVSKEIIEELVQENQSFDWRSSALGLVRKRKTLLKSLPREVQKRRLVSFLLRRGFNVEMAWSVVDEALKDD